MPVLPSERLERLQKQFPQHSRDTLQTVLEAFEGHAGKATAYLHSEALAQQDPLLNLADASTNASGNSMDGSGELLLCLALL